MLNDQSSATVENYDPSHKTSSVVSAASDASSLWDPLPSLYSGRADSIASVYDLDDLQTSQFIHYDNSYEGSLTVHPKEGPTLTSDMLNNNDKTSVSDILNSFLNEELLKKEQVIDHTIPTPALSHGNNGPVTNDNSLPTIPSLNTEVNEEDKRQSTSLQPEACSTATEKDHSVTLASTSTSLSYDQKRANHIASEQKRRNIIRGGFKELTELIPTLKDINNSKSTILFKSVDYMKHLEKRNKSLKERLSYLQAKVQQKHRVQRQQQRMSHHHHTPSELPTNATIAALLLHRNQQRQLELLQEQLKRQQELLAKHNIPTTTTTSCNGVPSVNTSSPIDHYSNNSNIGYSSISIPVMNDTPTTSATTSPTLLHASLSSPFVNSTLSPASSTTAALVIPASFEDYQQLHSLYDQHLSSTSVAPSFTIPADDNFHYHHQQNVYRERLLTSGKLNHLRKDNL